MKTTSLLIATALAFTASAATAGDASQQILAKVNDEPITVAQLREQFIKRHGGHTKFLGGETELLKFLQIVIDQRLLIQEAYSLGLDSEKEVKEPTDAYREQKAIDYLLKSELDDKAVPTKKEVREAWEKNTPTFYQVRHIAVGTRQEGEEIREALLHGADFDALARECSLSQSRLRGGQLAPFGWGAMEPAWEEAIFKLEPGEISPVFETREGFQVVQLQDKIDTARPDFVKAAPRLEAIIKGRKLDERRKLFSEELWAKYHVVLTQSDRSPRTLLRLKTTAADTVIATWDGGSLAAKDVLSSQELRMFALFPAERAAAEIDSRLRLTINDPLVQLEVKSRKTAETPKVAEAVRMFQEDRMESLLYEQHVLKDVKVTDDEIRAYYDAHKADLVSPEQRRMSHIVLATQELAVAVRNQIMGGEDFAALAKTRSQDVQSARGGGDLGWITKGQVPKEFAAVLTLQEGDVSEPIQSKFGWHVIKVTAIESGRQRTLDEAKEDIRTVVLQKMQREKRAYWVKKLRDAAKISVNKRAVRAYVKANDFTTPKEMTSQHGGR